MTESNLKPFVKWVGGKRQLLGQIFDRMPKSYNRYFEPFVGGGAVLFRLKPNNAVINDINAALINAYRIIESNPFEFIELVKNHDERVVKDGKDYYYHLRDNYNKKVLNNEFDLELAAMFVFLNKHGFNGLYRVNKKGCFNVPYNNNSKNKSIRIDKILRISEYLKNVSILQGDFEQACENAKEGDFVFFDSPYAPINPTSFESYTKEGFDIESHERLSRLFDRLTAKGCFCMLTNHNTEFINELYGNKGYSIDVTSVRRMVNSDASNRIGEEVIICNY